MVGREQGAWSAALLDVVLPGGLVVAFAFQQGGFFAETVGWMAAGLFLALAVRFAATDDPLAGVGRAAWVAIGGLSLLAAWAALSWLWSGAPARALLEADRVALYLAVFALFASRPWSDGRLRRIRRGFAAAAAIVCACALVTRVLPELWPTTPNVLEDRLSYPLGYWNALALLAALGVTSCLQLAADPHEPRWIRAPAAGAMPVLAGTLVLTYSRGGIAVAVCALAASCAIARPAGLAGAIASTGVPSTAAGLAAWSSELLATSASSAAALEQGRRLALAVVACAVAAAALQLWLSPRVDRGVRGLRGRRASRWPSPAVTAAVLACLALVGAILAVDQYQRFTQPPASDRADVRERLLDPSNNGRIEYWRVATGAFRAEPLRGTGAGTYQLDWWSQRRTDAEVSQAHSLYLQTLAELGLPGLLLVVAVLALLVLGLVRRRAGADRTAAGTFVALALAWVLHAGLDWDWEVPAVTVWLFAAGGAALARPATTGRRPWPFGARAAGALALAAAAVMPWLLATSERRVDRALTRLEARDCEGAVHEAQAARAVLHHQPEPPAIMAICDAAAGRHPDARHAMSEAIDLDPRDWQYRFDLAVLHAAAGQDPSRAIAGARRLNPRAPALLGNAEGAGIAGRTTPLRIRGLDYPALTDLPR